MTPGSTRRTLADVAVAASSNTFLHVGVPILVGLAFLALVFLLYWVWKRSWNVLKLAEGADGRLSTSKFQVLLWTIVVLFGYVVVETGRFVRGNFDALDKIPPNVLIALGFTIGTATLARGSRPRSSPAAGSRRGPIRRAGPARSWPTTTARPT